jgi:hypothetical protein
MLFWYKHKIHELVIFNQTLKIDAHEEKYFHSISYSRCLYFGLKIILE